MIKVSFSKQEAEARWAKGDARVNQRLQWFGIIQGLLFTAYALSFQASGGIDDHDG